MRIEIIQNGQTLRQVTHDSRTYLVAPPEGDYEIRLTNNNPGRRLAVVTVDGMNIVDGSEGNPAGPGYVLRPWETATIPGWRRSDSTVAKFTFTAMEGSYSNQIGRGTKNVGVIGVAVFEEKAKPVIPTPSPIIIEKHHHHYPYTQPWVVPNTSPFWWGTGTRIGDAVRGTSTVKGTAETEESSLIHDSVMRGASTGEVRGSTSESDEAHATHASLPSMDCLRGMQSLSKPSSAVAKEIGTAYGQEATSYVNHTDFERATKAPALTVVLQYATAEKLESWGIPVTSTPPTPEPFPAAPGYAPAPQGWRG